MSSSSLLHAREVANSLLKRGGDNVWRQRPQLDVFMQPVDDSGSPASEVRIIEVTDAVRAADAAERAAREAKPDVTWKRPEPLPARTYILPSGRSNGKRRSTKTKALATPKPKLAPPAQPQPQPTRKPRRPTTMNFTIGEIVHNSDVPARRNILMGRVGIMLPVYEKLATIPDNHWLPITFADKKQAYMRTSGLRSIAKKNGYKVEVRSKENDLRTLYFRLVKAETEEAAA